jgi:hypothetical protein
MQTCIAFVACEKNGFVPFFQRNHVKVYGFFRPSKKPMQKCMEFFFEQIKYGAVNDFLHRNKHAKVNPCKSALTFLAIEAKTMRKLHGFFRRTKKLMQKCMDFSRHRGQNHAKTAWVFSPDEKTHAKVH